MGGGGSGSGFREGGSSPQTENVNAMQAAQGNLRARSAVADAYYARIGNSPSRVKYERIKSLNRGDGVFLTDDELKHNIEYATGRNAADVQSFQFVSIPDNSGYADVEVAFQNPVRTQFTGGVDMGTGRRIFRATGGGVTRQTISVKILNP